MTPLSDLETMFDNMRSQTAWDIGGKLLWGYFFFDPNQATLMSLAKALENAQYVIANLYLSEDKITHVLHAEKVEAHTPQSLFNRNDELAKLAIENGVASYDGFDVAPPNTHTF